MSTDRWGLDGRIALFVLVAAVLAATSPAGACATPVFRYALERWQADPYDVTVFHRGKLTDDQQKVVAHLREVEKAGQANLKVTVADLGGAVEGRTKKLWAKQGAAALPRIVVTYPIPGTFRLSPSDLASLPLPPVAWAAPLTMDSANALIDSPLRKTIAGRLLKGESGVWVLVECGDAKADEAAAKLLSAQIAKATATFKLTEEAIQAAAQGGPPLKIAFSMVRLKASDKAEQAFLGMLMGLEDDLAEAHKTQPMAFLVYGRGRAVNPLVGKGINADNILGDCEALTGPCTCEVKEGNRGVDVLVAADWNGAFADVPVTFIVPPPLVSLGGLAETADKAQTRPAGDQTPQTQPARPKATTRPAPKGGR